MAGGGESRVLNCGYGRGFTVREVIDMVKLQSGIDFRVTETGRRAGDPGALMADNARIREVLGWEPSFDDLKTIVSTALAWEKIWVEKQAR
jgi:UDP-glucose 4-epimerase